MFCYGEIYMSKQGYFVCENNAHTLECVVKVVGVRNLANSSFIIICRINLGNLFADFHFSLLRVVSDFINDVFSSVSFK